MRIVGKNIKLGREVPHHGLRTWVLYVILQVLLHLAIPLAVCLLLYRSIREPGHLRGFLERFGLGRVETKGAVWIYAASLGETRASAPLIRQIRAAGRPVLMTHLSPAGLAEGWRLFPDDEGVAHRFMPLDLFWAVRLFLNRTQPAIGVVLEIEIYPAMLLEARRAGVPMVMANGNLLEESLANVNLGRRHLLKMYQEFTHIFTRNTDYRDRYIRVGVLKDRISCVGELKSDLWIDPKHPVMGLSLRSRWDVERVLLIASSVRDEEAILLPIVEDLLCKDGGLGVIWVPRSAQRFGAVIEALKPIAGQVLRRSKLGTAMEGDVPKGCRLIVGDSIGEMNAYYAMADLVFVGASLVPHGGHNVIEPMAHRKGVVMGPSIYGVAFAAEPAQAAGALEVLPNPAALCERISELLSDPVKLSLMGEAAFKCQAHFAGAASRTWVGIEKLLAERENRI